jgi:MFS family permease
MMADPSSIPSPLSDSNYNSSSSARTSSISHNDNENDKQLEAGLAHNSPIHANSGSTPQIKDDISDESLTRLSSCRTHTHSHRSQSATRNSVLRHGTPIHPSTSRLSRHESLVEPSISLFREAVFILIICTAQLMTQAALGQVIASLHVIGDWFSTTQHTVTSGELSWFAAGYSLTVGTFILPAGRLGDLYGHKKIFIIGFAWFGVWSLIAGFSAYAKSQVFFAVCRAMQGIGPALLLPNALAILGRTYHPGPRKDMAFSLFGATAPGGFCLGATFSSLLAKLAWWPWAFWIMGIACLALAALGIVVIPHIPESESERFTKGQKGALDLPGACTGVAGLVLINFAWNQGPVVGWPTVYVYVLLIVGFLFVLAFFLIERRAAFPLLPISAFTGETGFVLACMAAGWSSFGIWVFYQWQFQEISRGDSPLNIAGKVSPTAVSGLVAAVTSGLVMSRVRPAVIMVVSMSGFCIGNIITATAPVAQTYWAQIFVAMVIMPWGMVSHFLVFLFRKGRTAAHKLYRTGLVFP